MLDVERKRFGFLLSVVAGSVFLYGPASCADAGSGRFLDDYYSSLRKVSIGWIPGACGNRLFYEGLAKDCSVLSPEGPDTQRPADTGVRHPTIVPIHLQCEEDSAGVFELTFAVNKTTSIYRLNVAFRDHVPVHMKMESLPTQDRVYDVWDDIDLQKPPRGKPARDMIAFMGVTADLEQFVCRSSATNKENYEKLLGWYRDMLRL